MFSRRLYIRILLQVVLIVCSAGIGLFGIISGKAFILGILFLLISLLLIGLLVRYLNISNRKVKVFLEALQDNESMLFFPDKKEKGQNHLHHAFNKANDLLTELKLENRKQEQLHQIILQNIPAGVIVWNEKGEIYSFNNAALSLLNTDVIRSVSQLEKWIPDLYYRMDEALNNGISMLRITINGTIHQFTLTVRRLKIQQEEHFMLVLTDIERELSRKEYESWNKLTHVLTHEIMNSMAPVVSLSNTMLSYFTLNGLIKQKDDLNDTVIPKTVRGLETIAKQGKALLKFTESYRSLSFLQKPEKKFFSLINLMDDIILLFHSDLDAANILLKTSFPSTDIIIYADPGQISQVLINLFRNSMEAVNDRPDGRIEICVLKEKDIIIEITDNGCGIPETHMEDIFVPFYTTKDNGSGIGLSLSAQIIRMHQGDISFTSEPYVKTTARIRLPQD